MVSVISYTDFTIKKKEWNEAKGLNLNQLDNISVINVEDVTYKPFVEEYDFAYPQFADNLVWYCL